MGFLTRPLGGLLIGAYADRAGRARRGLFVSWQNASQGVAICAAGLVGLVLSSPLDQGQMAAWGWRVPFALGLLIVPVGLHIRRRLPETLEAPGTRSSAAVLGLLWPSIAGCWRWRWPAVSGLLCDRHQHHQPVGDVPTARD